MIQEAPRFLRAAQAAKILGVGRSTLWRWAQMGILPRPAKLSSRVSVWNLADLEKFVEARKGGNHAEAH